MLDKICKARTTRGHKTVSPDRRHTHYFYISFLDAHSLSSRLIRATRVFFCFEKTRVIYKPYRFVTGLPALGESTWQTWVFVYEKTTMVGYLIH